MLVNVTTEDIEAATYAKRHNPSALRSCTCPVAQAICRTLGIPVNPIGRHMAQHNPYPYVSVGANDVNIVGNTCKMHFHMPANGRQFIHDFDNSKKVGPITFVAPLQEIWRPDNV